MTNTYRLEAWPFVARWLLQVKYALSHTVCLVRVKIIKKHDNIMLLLGMKYYGSALCTIHFITMIIV